MIDWSACRNAEDSQLILRPNRSLSWRQAKWLILAFASLLGTLSYYFAQ